MSEYFDPEGLHPGAAQALNKSGRELISLAQRLPLKVQTKEPFPIRQEMTTLTDADIISISGMEYTDRAGRTTARYFVHEGHEVGLFDDGYRALRRVIERGLNTKPFSKGISERFLEEQAFAWWQARYLEETEDELCDFLLRESQGSISRFKMSVPLAALEIERAFRLGNVMIEPIDRSLFEQAMQTAVEKNPESEDVIRRAFEKYAKELGHLTAVTVDVVGEVGYVKQFAQRVAFDVAAMFRFMCPAAATWNIMFPCFPKGSDLTRTITFFETRDGRLGALNQEALEHGMFVWRVPFSFIDRSMKEGFRNFAALFEDAPITPFQKRVQTAINAYSEGVGIHDTSNRLIYATSALEHLFLRGGNESIQNSVGERIAFLISKDPTARREIVSNFKDAYALRSKQVHHLATVDDEATLSTFFGNAYSALHAAMQLMNHYRERDAFLDAIDAVKFGGS